MRSRRQVGKIVQMSYNFVRLWYRSTNTYSDPIYINSAIFSSYSAAEKVCFKKGDLVNVKENGKPIPAMIIAMGSFDEMHNLESILDKLAEEGCSTDSVIHELNKYTGSAIEELQSTDEDIDDSDGDPNYELSPKKRRINKEWEKISAIRITPHNPFNDRHESPSSLQSKSSGSAKLLPPNSEQLQSSSLQSKSSCLSKSLPLSGKPLQSSSVLPSHSSTKTLPSSSKQFDAPNPKWESQINLLIAEMRVQSTILKKILEAIEANSNVLARLAPPELFERTDLEFLSYNGETFKLSSLDSSKPTFFARDFLRKRYEKAELVGKLLIAKGHHNKQVFTDEQANELKNALESWYGTNFVWPSVVSSINQMLRQLK